MVIGEKLIKTTEKIKSVNPARPQEIVGVFQSAGRRSSDGASEEPGLVDCSVYQQRIVPRSCDLPERIAQAGARGTSTKTW